ncbi:MAG: ECF transporter S component [Clostridium argentinense]|uniref:ECF transporter S component n=1 Tax=Clostridium faecium TaxID=2762223 RepID=A0ABR8YP41_9CLOT|nr:MULTISPECIES: ECF transporter S component [Clostridium]MBD8046012.1 ECF transporter S component [Clostridium faecium]MBS5822861.1 ECF transporter S component [Clostridium argentinense]MDU1349302.1 ECF transporter S component [Clostridium argentinense]
MGSNKATTKSRVNSTALSLVQVAIMAAIVYIATSIIHVPFISGEGVLHLGDSAIFVAAILLGKKKGAIAGAIGMALFDVLSPYIVWAPFTFVIKGLMAYTAGALAYRKGYDGKNFMNNLFAFTISGVVMIVGYFFAGWILYDLPNAVVAIPSNALQVAAGMVIALPLATQLKKHIKF